EREDGEDDPLDDAVEPAWGGTPFSTPEEITLHLASQHELRNLLKHCIQVLSAAPNQLQAVIEELREFGADELLQNVVDDLSILCPDTPSTNPHMSQHKDHAHRKLRHCLQQQSTNLTVTVALRITEYTTYASDTKEYSVTLQALQQSNFSENDVRAGLQQLAAENLLTWHGEDIVRLTAAQLKRLTRYYKDENA